MILALLCCGAAAGCTADVAEPPPAAETPASTRLVLAEPTVHLDTTAREPMLIEHPDGSLFVSGYARENPVVDQSPQLWKSSDGGATWDRVNVGTLEQGAVGNSDVDLAVGPDGAIYFATMGFDRNEATGTHVAVGISRDVGSSWEWTTLSRDRAVDRPWVVVAPDGGAHVVWNDGAGVSYVSSDDGGRTWTPRRKIAPRGGSSHLAVGPAGELALRVIPLSASGAQRDDDAEWIFVSTDGGDSWARHVPPGTRAFDGIVDGDVPRWVEPLAWDESGALFYLWSEGTEMWLGRSVDGGASWATWRVVQSADTMFYPYLVARGEGELAASWFSAAGESFAIHVALLDAAVAGEPIVSLADPFASQAWTPTGAADAGGEYVPVIFVADGGLAVAVPIQDAANSRLGFAFRKVEIQ